MGWLWASPSPPSDPNRDNPAQNPQTQKPDAKNGSAKRDDAKESDSDLNQFLAELRADLSKPDNAPKTQTQKPPQPPAQPPATTSTLSSWFSSLSPNPPQEEKEAPAPTSTSHNPTPGSEALAHSLRPSTMSCRQAFDLAYACQSIGGQFTSVYREGGLRSCSHLWDDFWFCMRIKSYSGPVSEEMVREHYRKKELDKYGGKPNSEDVWASREERVAPGSVFREPIMEEVVSDEEWQLMEIQRRTEIRKQLGYED